MKKERFERELQIEIRQKKREQMERALKHSGLDVLIKQKAFDNYIAEEPWQERAKASCQRFAANPDGWLFVSGQTGAGKTHLCTAVAGELIRAGYIVWYMLYRQDIAKLKPMTGSDMPERERLMQIYRTAEVLYIDDLFKGGYTDADVRVMFDLIDARYRSDRITIISSELTMDDLEAIDEAIAGRIMEKSKKVIIKKDKQRNFRFKEWRRKLGL